MNAGAGDWIAHLLSACQAAFTRAASTPALSPATCTATVPEPGPIEAALAGTEALSAAQITGLDVTQQSSVVSQTRGCATHITLAAALPLSVALLVQLTGPPFSSALQASATLRQAVDLLLPGALAALSSANAAGNGFRGAALRSLLPALLSASTALGSDHLGGTLRAIWAACRRASSTASRPNTHAVHVLAHFTMSYLLHCHCGDSVSSRALSLACEWVASEWGTDIQNP